MLNLLAQADPNDSGIVADQLKIAEQVLTKISEFLAQYGLQIVGAILILVIGRWLAKFLSKLSAKAMTRAKVEPTIISFAEHFVYIALLICVILAAVKKAGVDTTMFAASLAAAGLAVGLALQGSLSNFASGILLLIFRPIRVGEFVEIGGVAGTVKDIQIFNTILDSPDNVRIIVPNAQVTGGNIKNYTSNGTRRVDLVIGVAYEDDLKKARTIIEKVLGKEDRILVDPAATVAVSELADSSVNFVVRPWVKTSDYWDVYFALTEGIKVALDKGGISIPFPQRDLHIKSPISLDKTGS